MTRFALLTVSMSLMILVSTAARADLLDQYGIGKNGNIEDKYNFGDNIALYQLFNGYFADQGAAYSSSNELFNDRGVDPATNWTTNGSQLVGGFKVADLGHTLYMIDNATGNSVAELASIGGTVNIGQGNGITNLGDYGISNIPDGLSVSFRLDADWNGTPVYSWFSDPTLNSGSQWNSLIGGFLGDAMVHMIALDITDLYNAKYGEMTGYVDSAYMFGWEDLHLNAWGGGQSADWDYQDLVVIMTNIRPEGDTSVPEPATIAVLGLGLAGLGFVRRWKNK